MAIIGGTYVEGELVKIAFTFTTSGTPVDPTAVNLNYETPEGSTPVRWTYGGAGSIVRDSTGAYHANLDTTAQPGTWLIRVNSTGVGQAASDDYYITVVSSGAR